jgi:hypothetical protein
LRPFHGNTGIAVEGQSGCFVVSDHKGQQLAYAGAVAEGVGPPGDQGCFFDLHQPLRISDRPFYTSRAERICHDAPSFRASTFGRGSFLLMIAKLPELLSRRLRLQGH